MIGDNLELDIKGAQNAGINTIWINPKKYMSDDIQTVSVEDIMKINEQLIESLGWEKKVLKTRLKCIRKVSPNCSYNGEEGILTIDLDLEEQRKYREELPVLEQI